MNIIVLSLIVIFQLSLIVDIQVKNSKSIIGNENKIREGKWINNGIRNIIGAGSDKIIEILRNGKEIEMIITDIKYFSINEKREIPEKKIKGPLKIKNKNQLLILEYQNEVDIKTFRFENDTLVWPAIVKMDKNIWYYKSNNEEYKFICENDPEIIMNGKAKFSSTSSINTGWEQYYSMEYLKDGEGGKKKVLKFYEKYKDGKVSEWAKIVWDKYGDPRFEGTSWYLLNEVRYISVLNKGN